MRYYKAKVSIRAAGREIPEIVIVPARNPEQAKTVFGLAFEKLKEVPEREYREWQETQDDFTVGDIVQLQKLLRDSLRLMGEARRAEEHPALRFRVLRGVQLFARLDELHDELLDSGAMIDESHAVR